jgi:SprT protein
MKTIADFTALVKLCIETAEAKYGKIGPVEIRCDIRGKTAGYAGWKTNRWTGENSNFFLRFNREAIAKHWDEMVQVTIPHEVAHLVCAAHPELGGRDHNWKWAQIDRSLGGNGERCHNMELTPGRKTARYVYKDSLGREMTVGPKHHAALQRGKYGLLRNRKTGATITRGDYLRPAA